MVSRKIFTALVLAGALCVAMPAAAAQPDQAGKPIDPRIAAEALKKCPAFQGGNVDPAVLAAMKNCPAFQDPQAPNPQKCPAFSSRNSPNPQNCPAFQGMGQPPKGSPQAVIDKKMNRIVKALERNKRSADTLINAARNAGASPESVADMQRMSEAFRQVFMSTVSPEQIINSLLEQRFNAGQPQAAPAPATPAPVAPEGMIITGPDGSTWLITPAPGQQGAPQAAPQPAPQAAPRAGIPPAQGKPSAIGRQPQVNQPAPKPAQPTPPAIVQPQAPAPQGAPAPGFRMPPAPQQQPQAEVIIMEETITPEYLPLWPTKDDLGKDGVLKYLEKRSTTMQAN